MFKMICLFVLNSSEQFFDASRKLQVCRKGFSCKTGEKKHHIKYLKHPLQNGSFNWMMNQIL